MVEGHNFLKNKLERPMWWEDQLSESLTDRKDKQQKA